LFRRIPILSQPVTSVQHNGEPQVDISRCNGCHTDLQLHGGNRNKTEYCVFCHNANNTSSNPAQAINFAQMIHKIHTGEGLKAAGLSFAIGTTEFNDVRYPVMSPNGSIGDTAKCYMCHVNQSEAVFPIGLTPVKDPQGLLNPAPPTTSACTGCHFGKSVLAHVVSQTDTKQGESCDVCHGAAADFSVLKVHAGK
jgi:OmcA/MtrC family decaheme c-type cytochrome